MTSVGTRIEGSTLANVDLRVHPRQRDRRAGARAHAQVRRPPFAERRIARARRRALVQARPDRPIRR